jgi:hypothetical protein
MLFTLHVSSADKSYVTQHRADDWEGARDALIASEGFREFAEALMPITAGAPLTSGDIVLMIPMTGLKHCWLLQGGRSGEYFTAVVIRTDDTGEIEEECDFGPGTA